MTRASIDFYHHYYRQSAITSTYSEGVSNLTFSTVCNYLPADKLTLFDKIHLL